jgi:hypothetical protein
MRGFATPKESYSIYNLTNTNAKNFYARSYTIIKRKY